MQWLIVLFMFCNSLGLQATENKPVLSSDVCLPYQEQIRKQQAQVTEWQDAYIILSEENQDLFEEVRRLKAILRKK